MRVVTSPIFFENGCACALGTFDGVHLGHKSVLAAVTESGYTPVAVAIIQNGEKKRIFPASLNLKYLEKTGIDTVLCLNIADICDMTPDEYLKLLFDSMNVKLFACGYNHRFGKGAEGSFKNIKNFASNNNISCQEVSAVSVNGIPVSSTAVRQFISSGEISKAAMLLGHDYVIDFTVIHGDNRGEKMGFPTINQLYPDDCVLPKFGVYATVATVDGVDYPSVTNVGVRPTFVTQKPLAETHIIGFDGNLYGKNIEVSFKEFLRSERKFDNIDDLINAIAADKEISIKIFEHRI